MSVDIIPGHVNYTWSW